MSIMKYGLYLIDENFPSEFIKFLPTVEQLWLQWSEAVTECRRLQQSLDESHHNSAVLVGKLTHARKLLDQERKACKAAERDRRAVVSVLRNGILSLN